MRSTQQFSITLPNEMAEMVRKKVASESEVIRDGQLILSARDAVVKEWLRNEVVPTYGRV